MRVIEIITEHFITGREGSGGVGMGYLQYRNHEGDLNLEVLAKSCEVCHGSGRRKSERTMQRGNSNPKAAPYRVGGNNACRRCDGTGYYRDQNTGKPHLMYGTHEYFYNPDLYADDSRSFEKDFPQMYKYINANQDSDKTAGRAAKLLSAMGGLSRNMFSELSNGKLSSTKVALNGEGDITFIEPSSRKPTMPNAPAPKKSLGNTNFDRESTRGVDNFKKNYPELYSFMQDNPDNTFVARSMSKLTAGKPISKQDFRYMLDHFKKQDKASATATPEREPESDQEKINSYLRKNPEDKRHRTTPFIKTNINK